MKSTVLIMDKKKHTKEEPKKNIKWFFFKNKIIGVPTNGEILSGFSLSALNIRPLGIRGSTYK